MMAPLASATMRVLLLTLLLPLAQALKFDLLAHPQHSSQERCIRNFVNQDTLVVVTATISGAKGDGQSVNMHVRSHASENLRI